MRRVLTLLAAATLGATATAGLRGQCVWNISTGFDQELDMVVFEGDPDDEYSVDGPLGFLPNAFTGGPGTGFPIPPWLPNDERSLWISPVTNAVAPPGVYTYEISFNLPPEVDASRLVIAGRWATDDPGIDVVINDVPTGITGAGFTAWTEFPENAGLGLFKEGTNTIQFIVENGGVADNPTGVRIEACVEVPQAQERPLNVSTGFDRTAGTTIGDGESDPVYTVIGPGLKAQAAVAVPEDGFPIPPWLANSVNSRWIGLGTPDSSGPPGEYTYRMEIDIPAAFDASRLVLRGGMAADDAVSDVLINGEPAGLSASGPESLAPFPVDAGQGLFRTGANTIEFIVLNDEEGPTGLRVDAEIAEGPPPVELPPALFSIDTGFDDAAGTTIPNGAPDDHWLIKGPPGSDIGPEPATVVPDDAFPIPPWFPSTDRSKWIGPNAPSASGPPGTYTFVVRVEIPDGVDASQARLIGRWSSDNAGLDILVNGVSTGIGNTGNFGALVDFPPDAGLGLFENGINTLEFLVDNAPPGSNPVGLRVEAVVGVGEIDPLALASGLSPRGIGPLPPGSEDNRFTVTGPEGTGIGPRPAIVPAMPPGFPNSAASQWIGLDAKSSVGPAGTYTYDLVFDMPGHLNPFKIALEGGWAAATSGSGILINGGLVEGAGGAGPDALAPLPEDAGLGLFLPGPNAIRFEVENATEGPTGLRLEARLSARPRANPLDISTGFDQEIGAVLDDDAFDEDYTIVDPFGVEEVAVVVPQVETNIPDWAANTETSKWIGIPGAVAASPGVYTYRITFELTEEEAENAVLQGVFATDDALLDALLNGISLGAGSLGFAVMTPIPENTGLGLFQPGLNTLELVIENGGDAANPSGLRIDAVVLTGAPPPPPGERFVRGDADADGSIALTDAIRVLLFLFQGGAPLECPDGGDADDNGLLEITDGIRILQWLFVDAALIPLPPSPSRAQNYPAEDCGTDPTEEPPDTLDCPLSSTCMPQ